MTTHSRRIRVNQDSYSMDKHVKGSFFLELYKERPYWRSGLFLLDHISANSLRKPLYGVRNRLVTSGGQPFEIHTCVPKVSQKITEWTFMFVSWFLVIYKLLIEVVLSFVLLIHLPRDFFVSITSFPPFFMLSLDSFLWFRYFVLCFCLRSLL